MRSKVCEICVGFFSLAAMLCYLLGHTSYLDSKKEVSGFKPSSHQHGNITHWIMPGADASLENEQPVPYYTHLWFVAYHPLLVVVSTICIILLLRYFNQGDRRPLFVAINQLTAAVVVCIIIEILYFSRAYRFIRHDGEMLTYMALATLSSLLAGCFSFYLLVIAKLPATHEPTCVA